MNKLTVKGIEINVMAVNDEDYISLTDMLKAKDGDFFISDWLRNRNTVEFLGIWEQIHNPDFNCGEFALIKSQAGLNSYKISVKEWVAKTGAVGLRATAGRYGGTYAHKDLAFEFGMWISAEFKIYLIKEFQRLKDKELKKLGWDVRRQLTKINYHIHTDAIKQNLIPPELSKQQAAIVYANEADVSQLVCLSNLETLNAHLVEQDISQSERLVMLNKTAIGQTKILTANTGVKRLEGKA
jgi:hypothetical protein